MTFIDLGTRQDLWLAGKSVPGSTYLNVEYPYDGSHVAEVAVADLAHVNEAVDAAKSARRAMASLPRHRRAEILETAAELLIESSDEFAEAIVYEVGKTIRDAKSEVARSADILRMSAHASLEGYGEVLSLDAQPRGEGKFAYTIRQPVGTVAAITGFNVPMQLALHKLGPAIAAGCPIVLKPATATPITGLALGRLLSAAGVPDGGVSVVCGTDAGPQLVTHPDVALVSFTGGDEVGRWIMANAGFKRVHMELGSNAATILTETGDIEKFLDRAVPAGFGLAGQSCISLQRLFVHESLYEEVLGQFADRVTAMKQGDPFDENTDIGTVISPSSSKRIKGWIDEAVEMGARVKAGGALIGRLLQPTVLMDIRPDMKVWSEEIFGPVVGAAPFQSFEEAIGYVNDSRYGLQAGVFTQDLRQIALAAEQLEVGGVMVNDVSRWRIDSMPYGGVKSSGVGREGPRWAIEEMTEMKLVVLHDWN